ncbi:glycerate kinase [Mergibacter septicus]|uniref:glycerate kinase n=1 Tax=Mergibacter septicus TaxID=221402 RepID=UPI001178E504|nr:glycerate kinase [Mergibacter septicus]AWX14101.1 glycerate kinase [Mergibacter septicus]
MKIVIAPDSFKESLTSLEVAQAIEQGILRVLPNAEIIKVPMADGGEGTLQTLIDTFSGTIITQQVTAPLGNKINANFGVYQDQKQRCAVIEMAAASGLPLVPIEQRNPLITTTYGTGELIKAALDQKVRKIILGIGGSATNDAGVGMLQALGAKFRDKKGKEIGFGGLALAEIAQIDLNHLDPRLKQVQFEIACDVKNPLCGKNGASAIFAPQKGATPEQVLLLDNALAHFAYLIQQQYNKNILTVAGSGAAGGLGGGLLLLPNVSLKSGFKIISQAVKLKEKLQGANLVITGEGRMDSQSIQGKTPIGVAKLAQQQHITVIALVGCLGQDHQAIYQNGITAAFPIIQQTEPLPSLLKKGKQNLIATTENIIRFYHKIILPQY